MKDETKTLVIDNFGGRLNQYSYGQINSGLCPQDAAYVYGVDPFQSPGQLTWTEMPTLIDPTGSVLQDLIVAGKTRIEAGVTYLYCIGHLGRLYKIQVNDPTNYNPDYNNPVLLATLASNSPTFKRGGSLDFYGSPERIVIGHDKGATRIDLGGANEAFLGILGSWTQDVPRPSKQFAGNMYFGNGENLAQLDSTMTISTYAKLSPALPVGTQIRDLDVSLDGNYLQMISTRLALPDITSVNQDDKFSASTDSYLFWWNGSDTGATSYQLYPSFSLGSNITFGQRQFVFGYDIAGAAVYGPTEKIITHYFAKSPIPNAVDSAGSLLGWAVPEFNAGVTKASLSIYGPLDRDIREGWWRQFSFPATAPETDVICIPFQKVISDFVLGSSTNGYASGVASTAKMYVSALEVSSAPTVKYRLYKVNPVETGLGTPNGAYQTQTQLFSKKIKIGQIRVYTSPISAGNGFTISLNNGRDPVSKQFITIPNSSKTFTAGSTATIGNDLLMYNPQCPPTYGVGLSIANTGTKNMIFMKVEIDYTIGGI